VNGPMTLLRGVHRRLLRTLFGLDDDAGPLAHGPGVNRPRTPQLAHHTRHQARRPRVLKRWQATIAGWVGSRQAGGD
jgi:hypothetical protein